MPLTQFIKNAVKSQYFRRVVVRAIEDFIIIFVGAAALWSLCHVVSGILRALGVG